MEMLRAYAQKLIASKKQEWEGMRDINTDKSKLIDLYFLSFITVLILIRLLLTIFLLLIGYLRIFIKSSWTSLRTYFDYHRIIGNIFRQI